MIPEILAYLYSWLAILTMKPVISVVYDLLCTILPMGMACLMTSDWYGLFAVMAKTLHSVV
jgi:hypothetical protein